MNSQPKPLFYVGQRIVVDDYCIDRVCTTPDLWMRIPELPRYSLKAEKVPLRRETSFIGYILDQREKTVNGRFAYYFYRVRLDHEQQNLTLPPDQQEFWTTEKSYARRIRKDN